MTSPDFDRLSGRASSVLSDDELAAAQDVGDIENLLDRKFFKGGEWGNRRTRFNVSLKELLATDIANKNKNLIGTDRKEVPEFIKPLRSAGQIFTNAIRSIPIIAKLRRKRQQRSLGLLGKLQKKRKRNLLKFLRKKKKIGF